MQTRKANKEIETLKADTGKVIRDLTTLTSSLTSGAASSISAAAESFQGHSSEELNRIRVKLSDLSKQLEVGVKRADANVQAYPYMWVLGALGVGLLLGAVAKLSPAPK